MHNGRGIFYCAIFGFVYLCMCVCLYTTYVCHTDLERYSVFVPPNFVLSGPCPLFLTVKL